MEVALDAPQLGGLDVDGLGTGIGQLDDAVLEQADTGVGGRPEQGLVHAGDEAHQDGGCNHQSTNAGMIRTYWAKPSATDSTWTMP